RYDRDCLPLRCSRRLDRGNDRPRTRTRSPDRRHVRGTRQRATGVAEDRPRRPGRLARSSAPGMSAPETEPRRLTPTERLHEVTMAALQRAAAPPEHTVGLTLNAKGDVQIEVTGRGHDLDALVTSVSA